MHNHFGKLRGSDSAPRVQPSTARTCVLVAGMHRSGTSAVARLVNLLGADIARELMPAKADNVRGFWEPRAVVELHNRLLHGLGSFSADPLPLPPDWLQSAPAREAEGEIARFLEAEFGASRLFVVKDPRLARLLPLWLRLLDAMQVRAVVVIPVRNPLEVAASLRSRERYPLAKALLLYCDSYLQTELASRARPRCFVGFEDLLNDWPGFERRLRGLVGRALPGPGPDTAARIGGFLDPALRHHRFGRDDLARLSETSVLARGVHAALSAAVADDSEQVRAWFDGLRRSIDEATFLFRHLVVVERERIKTMEQSNSWRLTAPLRWMRQRTGASQIS